MESLLPLQFKSPSESSISRIHHHTFFLRTRQPACFRSQCSLPMATTMATVIDIEKLRLSSLESHLSSVAAERPLTYTGTIGPLKESLESSMVTGIFPTGKEATIAAAAAEAVALAKAAAKVAKDAASMFGNETASNSDHKASSDTYFSLKAAMLTDEDPVSTADHDSSSLKVTQEENKPQSEDMEDPTEDELKYLQLQLSESIAVRSGRQTERKNRRAKAAGKAAAGIVNVTSGSSSSSRKKKTATQEIDYSDPLRYLRGTTTTSRLLTANEELELSEGIQILLKLENLHTELKERCGSEPTFAQWAAAAGVDQKTLRRRLNHGIQCKDKMIKSNIRLVISIAKNYQGAGMNLQDLVQEGCRGLVRGTEKFDASKGFKFSTYAHWWIKQAVRKSLSDQSRTIRLPFHMVEATYRVREAKKQLFSENGRHPNDKEVAEATGLTMKRLSAVELTPKAPRSLDQKIGFNLNMKPSEIISDPDAETAEEMLIKEFMRQDLDKVLNSLNPRENQVVRWRFGLEDGRMKTLQEIGELMGVSRERVRQIESCAFRKLKNKKRTKNLQQYIVSSA